MKKIILVLLVLLVPALLTAKESQSTMMGSSGLINVPSGDTIGTNSVLVGSWFLMHEKTGYLPRILVSPIERWEIGGGIDIQDPNDTSWIVNSKYTIYDPKSRGGVKVAFGFNYQNNANEGTTWNNYQAFAAFTWYGWAKTSMMFGKTWGDFTNKDDIDFGIGMEKVLFAGNFGKFAIILDFSNFSYRFHSNSIKGAGDLSRGIFSGGIRVLLFKNKLNVDFISTDLLDGSREWASSVAFRIDY